jgi:hypothetical protein
MLEKEQAFYKAHRAELRNGSLPGLTVSWRWFWILPELT